MRRNLAARAGRWSAAALEDSHLRLDRLRPRCDVIGGAVGTKQLGDSEGVPGESGRMEKILDEEFRPEAAPPTLGQRPPARSRRPRLPAGRTLGLV
jgi:hypothetical protein